MRRIPGRVALLLLLGAVLPAFADSDSLDALMRSLAANPGGHLRFVERKFIALLDAPVESSGTLVYRPPQRLERHTEHPQPESMILDGDTLLLERGDRQLRLDLASHPEIGTLVDSIRHTLAGDRAALERTYELTLDGDAALWTLRLVPRASALLTQLRQITVSGHHGQVRSIAILQADGDRSELTLMPPAAGPMAPERTP